MKLDPKKDKVEFIPVDTNTFRGLANLTSTHFGQAGKNKNKGLVLERQLHAGIIRKLSKVNP